MKVVRIDRVTGDGGVPPPGGRESMATALVRLAQEQATFFHSGEDCYGVVRIDAHDEVLPLRSTGFKNWLGKIYFEKEERAANREALSTAITTLQGFARFRSHEEQVFVRVAEHGGHIYLDLADDQRRVIKVTAHGWDVIDSHECPVRFRRPHGMLPLPMPSDGGSLLELPGLINVADEDFPLVIGWLLTALHPRGPYFVLVLHGEQGSGKSSTARVVRSLLDPNQAPVRAEPREPRDFIIAASNSWIVSFDNLSSLSPWVSDAMCRVSTGGGLAVRQLYTDSDEIIFQAKRPAILNGIEELATRGDLLDRAIVINLPQIRQDKRMEERILDGYVKGAQPRLLGALLNAASRGLAEVSEVNIAELPRMADATVWVTACETGLGFDRGTFLAAYTKNQVWLNDLPLETPLGEALRSIPLPFKGTATDLLGLLESNVDERARRRRDWPTSARALRNRLDRLAPNLRRAGLAIEFTRDGSDRARRRIIQIREEANQPSEPSEPSASNLPSEPMPNVLTDLDASDESDGTFPILRGSDGTADILQEEL